MAAILHRCVALTGLADAYVAMVASRGRPRVGGSRRPADCDNHFIAYAIPWIDVIPKDVQERGAHLWIASVPRVPDRSVDPTVKNYQWSDLTGGLMEAHDHGFDTAILCDAEGFVTEGPGFNIFVVKDGVVLTPDRGSLHGITANRCWSCAPWKASPQRSRRYRARCWRTRTRSSPRPRRAASCRSRASAAVSWATTGPVRCRCGSSRSTGSGTRKARIDAGGDGAWRWIGPTLRY